ncbi:unnamed protein product [Sphagnum jensenii]|uniref:Stress-response A/B barrel domain-containing protein n=1 Tax=Sphagnum jensenii TaxID=128206 RepID=A0ABP1B9D0_9BRYO
MLSPLLRTLLGAFCLCSFITHHQEPAAALSLAIIMDGGGDEMGDTSMELHADKTIKTRNVVEHTVIFQFKPNVTDKVKHDIVDGLWSLDEQCREQVQATSLGYILHPEQAKGAAIGLYMRFFSKEALQEYLNGGPKSKVVDIMIPHMTGEITVDFESQIEDNENSVYRKGKAFAGGIEHIVYIKVKERTSQDAIDEMVKALNDLNFAPELSSLLVQITAGANFCKVDNRYTHAFVARCPSVEAVQSFSSHPYYIDVFSKKVLPILEASLTADYVVDRVRHLTALL